jgi:hypothetical protein
MSHNQNPGKYNVKTISTVMRKWQHSNIWGAVTEQNLVYEEIRCKLILHHSVQDLSYLRLLSGNIF